MARKNWLSCKEIINLISIRTIRPDLTIGIKSALI